MRSIKGYKGEQLHEFLQVMLLIRRFEEKAGQMYGLRKISGFCHLYIGQEAVAVGSLAAADLKRDYVLTAYRDHGHALAVGMPPMTVMAELFGKATGSSGGKGGSMHMFDISRHFLGGNGIVGAQIPVATGVALGCELRETGGITFCYLGDGAMHQGSFHESLNLARIWRLPILYICENNEYGMGTHFARVSAVPNFAAMTAAYDIPGRTVNGMDVIEVYEETVQAIESVRTSHIPQFLEMRTHRYRGHSMSDPANYRNREDLERAKELDPIAGLASRLRDAGLWDDGALKRVDEQCKKAVDDAVRFAEESLEPAPDALFENVVAY